MVLMNASPPKLPVPPMMPIAGPPRPRQPESPAATQQPQPKSSGLRSYKPDDPENCRIEGLTEGEHEVVRIQKHPWGIIQLYLGAIFAVLLAAVFVVLFLPDLLATNDTSGASMLLGLAAVVGIAFLGLILMLATYIYFQNTLIITNKNITLVLQRSLFSRQVSELSMASVEDVTADQRGIIATLLNYGELRVETAGEQNNFIYGYCPRPNYYGKIILDARQAYADSLQEEPHGFHKR